MFKKEQLELYFICGTQDCPAGNLLEVLEEALESGITFYQFREKGKGATEGSEKKQLAQAAKKLCEKYNVPFLINDDIELALELGADGVHIGQDDMVIEDVRKLFPNKIIGLSINNLTEYKNSKIELADYLGIGPIFQTISKNDAKAQCGLTLLENIKSINKEIPLVAIGGITPATTRDIMLAGADGVAVISAIARAENKKEVISSFLKATKI